jgi:hypothetical protein
MQDKEMEFITGLAVSSVHCLSNIHTKDVIINLGDNSMSHIDQFRQYMLEGRTFTHVGDKRKKFHKGVVDLAKKVRQTPPLPLYFLSPLVVVVPVVLGGHWSPVTLMASQGAQRALATAQYQASGLRLRV